MTQSEPEHAEVELVYHADGGLELRDGVDTDRWIATDSPVEVRQ
ncbi:hypothetical protein [Natranaeroarchaeum sulfidigenes]|nr:hypothetical protein [Natranaeroarchaeum sulfidigenes]